MVVRRLSFDRCEAADYIKKTADLNKNKNKTYHIVTYGCQMNVHDSERLAGMLEAMGYKNVKIVVRLILSFSIPAVFVRMLNCGFMVM